MSTVTNFTWIEATNYEEMSKIAATIYKEELKRNPKLILGLATGGTPKGLYKELVKAYKAGEISFELVQTFNLDEYVGIDPENEASYHYYMDQQLFNHVNIKSNNIYLPKGNITDLSAAAKQYDMSIEAAGGIDIQLLGIGVNGHIGFNEPGTPFTIGTNVVALTESTRAANKKYFNSSDRVPTHAITMGIQTIMNAKKVILLISDKSKQEAMDCLRNGKVTEDFPASALHDHKNVTVIYTGVK